MTMKVHAEHGDWFDAVLEIEKDGRIFKIQTHFQPWDEVDLEAEGKELKIKHHALQKLMKIGREHYHDKLGWTKKKYESYCRNNPMISYYNELEIVATKFIDDNF